MQGKAEAFPSLSFYWNASEALLIGLHYPCRDLFQTRAVSVPAVQGDAGASAGHLFSITSSSEASINIFLQANFGLGNS